MSTKILILGLACVACVSLVACGHSPRELKTITCSMDDTISFAAYSVNAWTFSDGAIQYEKENNFFVYNLGPREFCSVSNSREQVQ